MIRIQKQQANKLKITLHNYIVYRDYICKMRALVLFFLLVN